MISRLISAFVAGVCLVGLAAPVLADQTDSDGYAIHRKHGGYSYDKSELSEHVWFAHTQEAPPWAAGFQGSDDRWAV